MNRRGFIGALSALVVVPVTSAASASQPAPLPVPRVQRATGKAFIVGVATETVQAGDFVQIQTCGPTRVNMT